MGISGIWSEVYTDDGLLVSFGAYSREKLSSCFTPMLVRGALTILMLLPFPLCIT